MEFVSLILTLNNKMPGWRQYQPLLGKDLRTMPSRTAPSSINRLSQVFYFCQSAVNFTKLL